MDNGILCRAVIHISRNTFLGHFGHEPPGRCFYTKRVARKRTDIVLAFHVCPNEPTDNSALDAFATLFDDNIEADDAIVADTAIVASGEPDVDLVLFKEYYFDNSMDYEEIYVKMYDDIVFNDFMGQDIDCSVAPPSLKAMWQIQGPLWATIGEYAHLRFNDSRFLYSVNEENQTKYFETPGNKHKTFDDFLAFCEGLDAGGVCCET